MTKNYFFIYPKDKNDKRTGHTICVLLDSDKEGNPKVYYGISLCSEKDQFSFDTGRTIALQRALEVKQRRLEE